MKDSSTVRYIGYSTLPDGGRRFDFSCALGSAKTSIVTIDAPIAFFRGPDQIAIQEAAGICYETLRLRLQSHEASPPSRFDLTAADIAQHRPSRNGRAGRR
jgi:hypothetical protein